jgi:hypothetical protein
VGLAHDGTSYLTRHSFEQIGERNPTADDLRHPGWQWDEQVVKSTNQRMEGLAINTLLVQLYQPESLTTGPPQGAQRQRVRQCCRSRRHGESAGSDVDRQGLPARSHPQGNNPWLTYRQWREQKHPSAPLAPGPLAHRVAWGEASEPPDAVVSAGVCGAQLSRPPTTPEVLITPPQPHPSG